jgi:hypothetical protein
VGQPQGLAGRPPPVASRRERLELLDRLVGAGRCGAEGRDPQAQQLAATGMHRPDRRQLGVEPREVVGPRAPHVGQRLRQLGVPGASDAGVAPAHVTQRRLDGRHRLWRGAARDDPEERPTEGGEPLDPRVDVGQGLDALERLQRSPQVAGLERGDGHEDVEHRRPHRRRIVVHGDARVVEAGVVLEDVLLGHRHRQAGIQAAGHVHLVDEVAGQELGHGAVV